MGDEQTGAGNDESGRRIDDEYDREAARDAALNWEPADVDAAGEGLPEREKEPAFADLDAYDDEERRQAAYQHGKRRRSLDPRLRREVLEQLFFEGVERVPYLFRFGTLLTLSVIIATLGLLADSTAVVIGAMLVAPLMTPVLAISASLVMGWPRRQGQMVLFVILASIAALVVAMIVAAATISDGQTALTNEILARTRPSLLDLLIGLAAGAVGAYVLVRKEAVAALPGVAVAVALVPPVSSVGVLVWLGDFDLAANAALLYVTNLVTIVLAGAVVLLIMGFKPKVRDQRLSRRVRVGIVTAVAGVIVVGVPLGIQSAREVDAQIEQNKVSSLVADAVGDEPSLRLTSVLVEDDLVVLDFIVDVPTYAVAASDGDAAFNSVQNGADVLDAYLPQAQRDLSDALGREVDVTARGVPRLIDSTCEQVQDCDPVAPKPASGLSP